MASTITRDEYKTYLRIKGKILFKDQETQTENEYFENASSIEDDFDEDCEDCDDCEDEDYEEEYEENQSRSMVPFHLPKNSNVIIISAPQPSQHKRFVDEDSYSENSDTNSDSEDPKNEIIQTDEEPKNNKKRRKVSDDYGSEEFKYYKSLPIKKRKVIDDIENQVAETNIVSKPLRFKIIESNMDIKLKSMAMSKLEQLYNIDPSSGEHYKLSNYIENMCRIPIGKYKPMDVSCKDEVKKISGFLDDIKHKLDETVYGHKEAKDQIIRLLAKWIANPESKGLVIALNGPMGCGKTLLCKSIADAIGLPMGFISLGGMASTDSSILLGHSQTYESSRWGKIVDVLMNAGCMNPVLFFDELDKVSNTRHGEEIINVLIHLTDATQNDKFHDRYYCDVDLDLSKCLIVFSYNHEEKINPILKDRITSITTSGYTNADKINIAKDYMLPKIFKDYALNPGDIHIDDETLYYIISFTEEEKGVRNMQRSLEQIISQVNLCKMLNKPLIDDKKITLPIRITSEIVDKFMTKKKKDDWPCAHIYM
jgi:ATP-dependent Lon protease